MKIGLFYIFYFYYYWLGKFKMASWEGSKLINNLLVCEYIYGNIGLLMSRINVNLLCIGFFYNDFSA